jgi:hypothetical protein
MFGYIPFTLTPTENPQSIQSVSRREPTGRAGPEVHPRILLEGPILNCGKKNLLRRAASLLTICLLALDRTWDTW